MMYDVSLCFGSISVVPPQELHFPISFLSSAICITISGNLHIWHNINLSINLSKYLRTSFSFYSPLIDAALSLIMMFEPNS